MTKACKLFLLMALALGLSASPALAGDDDDGGAKRNGRIQVVNNFGFPIAVAIDADDQDLQNVAGAGNAAQIQAAFEDELGGIILPAGDTAVFTGLKAGTHDVFATEATVANLEAGFANSDTATVNLDKGQTATLRVNADAAGFIDIED